MEHNEDLAKLEQFVERLIENHNQLKNERSELVARLQKKELEITELQDTIKSLQEDRSVIHNQVTGLIDRISEWEKILDRDMGTIQSDDPEEEQSQNVRKETSSLFNVGTEQPF